MDTFVFVNIYEGWIIKILYYFLLTFAEQFYTSLFKMKGTKKTRMHNRNLVYLRCIKQCIFLLAKQMSFCSVKRENY